MHAHPVALVTGGSRGLGRGICAELAQAGYAVAINYASSEDAARETQRICGAPAILCQGDVGKPEQRERLVALTLEAFGRIDVLVNNAGITSPGRKDILEAGPDGWREVMAVNLEGPFFLTQAVARHMIANRERLREPCVINIGSLSAYAVSTNRGDYCISKAGLAMLTSLWAVRLAEFGIRVYEVRAGVMDTDMTAGAKEKYNQLIADGLAPLRRWGTPEDAGKAVAALVTGALPFSTGDVVNIDGGYHLRRFP
jgi:NAD(P)-dependent dehydrogenase (short-subunit alcohol dehydrogenase family)